MAEFTNLINTLVREWWLIGAIFGVAGVWYQGQAWFKRITDDAADAKADIEYIKHLADQMKTEYQSQRVSLNALVEAVKDLVEISNRHSTELVKNSEQHGSIVKALEAHVAANSEHDNTVKASLAVIADRLNRK
jgi:hypothetical protein